MAKVLMMRKLEVIEVVLIDDHRQDPELVVEYWSEEHPIHRETLYKNDEKRPRVEEMLRERGITL